MSNSNGTQGRVSPNRKYVQLSVHDAVRLKQLFNRGVTEMIHEVGCHPGQADDEMILVALDEMIDKANTMSTTARICLAHAVVRVSK